MALKAPRGRGRGRTDDGQRDERGDVQPGLDQDLHLGEGVRPNLRASVAPLWREGANRGSEVGLLSQWVEEASTTLRALRVHCVRRLPVASELNF